MLLGSLIDKLQSDYADIQSQIDELQEQQREIQAKLQEIGSTESQMLSAVHLVQEAIQSCIEVCPEQLSHFQQTIINLFPDSKPVAALTPSQPETDPEPESESDPNPTPNQPQSEVSNVLSFPSVTPKADPNPEPKPEPLFKFICSHTGDYRTYWREEDDGSVTVIFKQLKIRPRNKEKTEGYNPFAIDSKGICWVAYLTPKAFSKIEDQSEWIDFDKLD